MEIFRPEKNRSYILYFTSADEKKQVLDQIKECKKKKIERFAKMQNGSLSFILDKVNSPNGRKFYS